MFLMLTSAPVNHLSQIIQFLIKILHAKLVVANKLCFITS